VRHLDPKLCYTVLHGASDTDEDLPIWLAPLKPWLRQFVRRGGISWYKLSDLNAEILAFAGCLGRRYDIVHFLDGEHSGQFLPRLVRQSGLSMVRTMATFHQPPEVAEKILNGDMLRWFDQVVLVSPSQLPFFRRYVTDERLQVILHGVDTDFFHPAMDLNSTGRIRCITVGHWLRDWTVFSQVARVMSDVVFEVVSGRQLEFGDLPNVRTHIGVDDAALAALYRSADILFLPLVQATANNALLEGIASGLPVVATDLEAVRAYLPSGEGCLVRDNRTEGFIDVLRRLHQDIGLRQEMGRRARLRAEQLSWPHLVRQYETLYERALAPLKNR
jgi:glycosyltransferase involved in cell wall biosynthesis